jgi:hypothetical protein
MRDFRWCVATSLQSAIIPNTRTWIFIAVKKNSNLKKMGNLKMCNITAHIVMLMKTRSVPKRYEKYTFYSGTLKERDHLIVLGIDARIILKLFHREMWYENVNWIRLAHNRAQWRAFVNTVMNLYLPEKR